MQLPAKYAAAKQALTEAYSIDEVKEIHDKSLALKTYAYQTKDRELLSHATEIQARAVRRLGELMEVTPKAKGTKGQFKGKKAGTGKGKGGGKSTTAAIIVSTGTASETAPVMTLEELGIDTNLAKKARKAAALSDKEFEIVVAKTVTMTTAAAEGSKEVIVAARAERHQERTQKRTEREKKLATKIAALPDKKYAVILADPEWKFDFWSEKGQSSSSAQNHYPVTSLEELKKRNVQSISADDCVLFLWATVPMTPQALEVMAAWGFDYVSHFCWVKNKAGTGYWNRNKHELLLIGTKGKIPAPADGTQFESAIEAPVGKHSEKPEKFLEIIETYYPTVPKIELNRRGPARIGWDAWGNEAEEAVEAA